MPAALPSASSDPNGTSTAAAGISAISAATAPANSGRASTAKRPLKHAPATASVSMNSSPGSGRPGERACKVERQAVQHDCPRRVERSRKVLVISVGDPNTPSAADVLSTAVRRSFDAGALLRRLSANATWACPLTCQRVVPVDRWLGHQRGLEPDHFSCAASLSLHPLPTLRLWCSRLSAPPRERPPTDRAKLSPEPQVREQWAPALRRRPASALAFDRQRTDQTAFPPRAVPRLVGHHRRGPHRYRAQVYRLGGSDRPNYPG